MLEIFINSSFYACNQGNMNLLPSASSFLFPEARFHECELQLSTVILTEILERILNYSGNHLKDSNKRNFGGNS